VGRPGSETGGAAEADGVVGHPETDIQLSFASSQGRWVIAAMVLGSGIASLDATVVSIALPTIGRAFHSGVGTLQWVVSGYALTLAAFLLLGGSLGDRLGRRRMFSVGVVWFAVASVCCGFAPNAGFLIAARVLQGVGGALLAPASLAILQASFRPDDRGRAIGAWSGLGGVATAAGPLLGGYLILASWRWVFFINVPVAVGVLLMTVRHVPESRDPSTAGHVDLVGAGLAVLFLAGLTYGLIEGPTHGWTDPVVLAGLLAAAATAPAFVVVEHARAHPLLPLGVFRSRQFSGANAVTFIVYGALGGAFFLLPVELQIVNRYSPLDSGLALLPVTVIMLVFSARSGKLAARIGPRLQMSAGPLVVGAGLLLLIRATHHGSYAIEVLPAVLVFGVGLAITVAPLTATAMGAAPAEHAGVASAVNNVVARAAGLLAVALLPLVAGITGASALEPHHLAAGFRTAVIIAGLTCAAGGLLAVVTIRDPDGAPTLLHRQLRQYHCALDGTPLQPSLPRQPSRPSPPSGPDAEL
jgi:EmrB/QacA subfamily drug resistance transporter